MQINRHNYEEFFILYLDNELSLEERRMVESFVAVHPDLEEELLLLKQTQLTPDEHIVFDNKADLYFQQTDNCINDSNYEEWLVLYADNELTPANRAEVEKYITSNSAAAAELSLINKVKFQPESIICPDKASLYRKEEKVRPLAWWKLSAAAAFILLAGSTAFFILDNKNTKVSDDLVAGNKNATNNKIAIQTPAVKETIPAIISNSQEQPVIANEKDSKKYNAGKTPIRTEKNPQENNLLADNTAKTKTPGGNNLPLPDQNPNVNTELSSAKLSGSASTAPKSGLTINPETRDMLPVTNEASVASLTTDNKIAADEFADGEQSNGKKNKFRGLLRKVTRNFEKRTKIDATDDDDRLLVGGLAIRLK